MKRYKSTTVVSVSLAALVSGCASMFHGTSDTITVTSLEKDAVIYVDGAPRGKDSAMAQVKRGDKHTIKVSKEGCQDAIAETGDSFDAISLLGILIDFGIITIPVDMGIGGAWKTDPTIYTVSPICKAASSFEPVRK